MADLELSPNVDTLLQSADYAAVNALLKPLTAATAATEANHVFVSGGATRAMVETPIEVDPATGDMTGIGDVTADVLAATSLTVGGVAITASGTELNFVDGVTSAIQTQLNTKGNVSDVAYDATTWNGNTDVPTKNAVRDKIESMGAGGSVATDAIFDLFGDEVMGTGADTSAKKTLSNTIELIDDFFLVTATNTGVWSYTGTTNVGLQHGDGSHWGVVRFRSTGADQGIFTGGGLETVQLGAGTCLIEWIFKTPPVSDGTDTYTMIVGLGDTLAAAQTDGVYFRYTHSVNSGKWERVTESNTSEEALDTGVAFAGSAWLRLTILIIDGTSAQFFINGTSVGTNSTGANIPTGSSRVLTPLWYYDRTAGTTQEDLFLDAVRLVFKPSTPR